MMYDARVPSTCWEMMQGTLVAGCEISTSYWAVCLTFRLSILSRSSCAWRAHLHVKLLGLLLLHIAYTSGQHQLMLYRREVSETWACPTYEPDEVWQPLTKFHQAHPPYAAFSDSWSQEHALNITSAQAAAEASYQDTLRRSLQHGRECGSLHTPPSPWAYSNRQNSPTATQQGRISLASSPLSQPQHPNPPTLGIHPPSAEPHRLDCDLPVVSSFDHGTEGRPAQSQGGPAHLLRQLISTVEAPLAAVSSQIPLPAEPASHPGPAQGPSPAHQKPASSQQGAPKFHSVPARLLLILWCDIYMSVPG